MHGKHGSQQEGAGSVKKKEFERKFFLKRRKFEQKKRKGRKRRIFSEY